MQITQIIKLVDKTNIKIISVTIFICSGRWGKTILSTNMENGQKKDPNQTLKTKTSMSEIK